MSTRMSNLIDLTDLTDLIKPYRTISIIGMSKNAGKTTALNHLIKGLTRKNQRLALTSIGRDGEDTDIVTKTDKPRICAPMGSIIITCEKLLDLCDITKEILAVTDIHTPLGRIVVVRAKSSGFVQLGGPSVTTQMSGLLQDLKKLGAGTVDKIIIDGAISRKSLASPSLADAAILCAGPGQRRNINTAISEVRHAVLMLTLPVDAAEFSHMEKIYLPGAISDARLKELVLSRPSLKNVIVVAADASKILASAATYEKLQIRGGILAVQKAINLVALTVNPVSAYGFSFDAAEFLVKMQEAVSVPVFDLFKTDSGGN